MKSAEKERILIVDDSLDTLEVIGRNLKSKMYKVFSAGSVDEAIKILGKMPIDLVVTDMKMPRLSGLDLVRYIKENFKDTEVMMITGYPSVEGAVAAVKTGAEEYLAKPFTDEELLLTVKRSLDKLRAKKATGKRLKKISFQGIIGSSSVMQKVFRSIEKAALIGATVLISGESGTGKELVARAVHYNSSRSSAPFVPVNCGGIPETLLESELFGHVKGAFTGATESRAGFFQTADGGTIFLDEISNTGLFMQAKLLRVLEDKQVYMVGASRPRKVDLRILAATNKNLSELVKNKVFREDLFYRLNVVSIFLPPLRERGDDITLLIYHFADKFAKEVGKPIPRFSDKALRILKNYSWPGNVRELENVIQHIIVMNDCDLIDVPDLPEHMRFSVLPQKDINKTLEEAQTEYIRDVFMGANKNITKAAKILNIDRKTLREKLKKITSS